MSFTIPTVFTAVDKLTAPMRKMTSGMQGFTSKAEAGVARLDRRLRKLTPSLGDLGKQMLSLASTGALIVLLSTTGSAILDFEENLVGVGKTTNTSGEALKKLGLDTIALSNSMKTVSSNELLEFAQSAGQLGVSGSENILKFSETMAKLKSATDIDGDEGSSSIARILNITKEGVGVVDKFGASLVALGNTSAATESEILGVASEVGRSTAAFGLASTTILGISAAYKSLGAAPQAAGTATAKVFKKIEQATLDGGKSLRRFASVMGILPKEVEGLLKSNPEEAFASVVRGLNKVDKEGGSMTDIMNKLGLSGEIVQKGLAPLAKNYDLLEEKLKLSGTAFAKNAALNEEFAASQKTVKNACLGAGKSPLSLKQAFSRHVVITLTGGSI